MDNEYYSKDNNENKEFFVNTNINNKKKRLKGSVLGIIAGAISIILVGSVIFFILCSNRKVDLSEYINMEISGYDGLGVVLYNLDYDGLYDYLNERYEMTESEYDKLKENFSIIFENNYSLCNGEIAQCTVRYSDVIGEMGYYLYVDENSMEVSGLKNVFDDIEIECTGTPEDVNIDVSVELEEEPYSYLEFEILESGPYKVGDTVTIEAVSLGDENGPQLKYTIDDICYYVETADDIDEDVIDMIKAKSEENINEVFSEESEKINVIDLEYVESYIAIESKDVNELGQICSIYAIEIEGYEGLIMKGFEKTKIYVPIILPRIKKSYGGKVEFELDDTQEQNDNLILGCGDTRIDYGYDDYLFAFTDVESLVKEIEAIFPTYNFVKVTD